MPLSPYYRRLRRVVGRDLLLVPSVAAVIHDAEGRVLIQHRADGTASLPAGAIEPGEAPAQAIVREVWEETGLSVRPVALLGCFGGVDYGGVYANGDVVEFTVCLFACRIAGGDLACRDGESAALTFLAPEAVPALVTDYPRRLLARDAVGAAFDWDEAWLVNP